MPTLTVSGNIFRISLADALWWISHFRISMTTLAKYDISGGLTTKPTKRTALAMLRGANRWTNFQYANVNLAKQRPMNLLHLLRPRKPLGLQDLLELRQGKLDQDNLASLPYTEHCGTGCSAAHEANTVDGICFEQAHIPSHAQCDMCCRGCDDKERECSVRSC